MSRQGVKRRGFGDGSIYPVKDGRWFAYLRLPDGKKKFFTGTTREAVSARLKEAQRQASAGRLVVGRDQPMAMYLDRWLNDAHRHSVRPRTHENYDLCVRRVLPYIGRVKLQALTPEHIQHALSALSQRGLVPSSVRQVRMVLRRALKQAVLWNLVATNATDGVTSPHVERKELRTLNEEEVRRLLTVARDTRYYSLWVFLITTGARVGEALALRWSDINAAQSTAIIRRSVQIQRGAGRVFVEPKTTRSRRTIPLPPETLAVLVDQRAAVKSLREQAGNAWQENDLVFPTPLGGPRETSYLGYALRRALRQAGLPPMRIHDLRHTAATHLLVKGVHPKVVQDLLGHSTIAITLDTYSHVMPALAKEASGWMSSLVPQGNL